jgi:hypothetical protein
MQLNHQKTFQKGQTEMFNNMESTEQVTKQFQCQACGKSMSAKKLQIESCWLLY